MALGMKPVVAIVPAAGVGKRMLADCPKQYLTINGVTIIEHTVNRLLSHPQIAHVVIAISQNDEYFATTSLPNAPDVSTVIGGKERVDSVLAGLQSIASNNYSWALVHDAARPCVELDDIDKLLHTCFSGEQGGLLAYPVRDTMKRGDNANNVVATVERENLWHALTPQMYPCDTLLNAINYALTNDVAVTDESSAIEAYGKSSLLIEGSSNNIKITKPDDLALATFILNQQQERLCE